MIFVAVLLDLDRALIAFAIGIAALDAIGAFGQLDLIRRRRSNRLERFAARAVGPFAIEGTVLGEGIDHRFGVAPVHHQHSPGELPGAMKHILADPPGEVELVLVLSEGHHAAIFAAIRIGAVHAVDSGEVGRAFLRRSRRAAEAEQSALQLAVNIDRSFRLLRRLWRRRFCGTRIGRPENKLAEIGGRDPGRLLAMGVDVDALQGTLEGFLNIEIGLRDRGCEIFGVGAVVARTIERHGAWRCGERHEQACA